MRTPTKAERADIAVAKKVAPARHAAPIRALGTLSELADQPPLMTICAVTMAAGLLLGDRRLMRVGARMLAGEVLATQLKSFVKHRIDRTRPMVLAEGGAYRAKRGDDHASAMTSFPSGHTAGAVAVARAIAREYPGGTHAAYTAAAAIGAIQIPRSKHYVSDVAAGAVVGLAAEQIVALGERLLHRGWRAWRRTGTIVLIHIRTAEA